MKRSRRWLASSMLVISENRLVRCCQNVTMHRKVILKGRSSKETQQIMTQPVVFVTPVHGHHDQAPFSPSTVVKVLPQLEWCRLAIW